MIFPLPRLLSTAHIDGASDLWLSWLRFSLPADTVGGTAAFEAAKEIGFPARNSEWDRASVE